MLRYNIDKETDCWIAETKCKSGYGPYRRYYLKYNGDIPKGLEVMHTCDNRKCINPSHLRLGTHMDNSMEATGQGQTKKLLSGLIKEKHFAGVHRLVVKRVELFGE